ncbi:MAG: DUF2478 domain-containing protein [Maritimibacter sp.]
MRLGYFTYSQRGEAERLMLELATALDAQGTALLGILAEPSPPEDRTKIVRLLPRDERINIWQYLGGETESCRLNPEALENAVESTVRAIAEARSGTLVMVNKFGKHEIEEGGGTRSLIWAALEAGLPALVPVPEDARASFEEFADGLAEALEPSPDALMGFAQSALAECS